MVETPRPPDLVMRTTGPGFGFFPSHGLVMQTNLAGLWYSKLSRLSTEQMLSPRKSSALVPKLHPRMVIFVPPTDGPDLPETICL